jgi:hypothetical protein
VESFPPPGRKPIIFFDRSSYYSSCELAPSTLQLLKASICPTDENFRIISQPNLPDSDHLSFSIVLLEFCLCFSNPSIIMGKSATDAQAQADQGKAIDFTGSYILELFFHLITPHM